MMRRLHLLAKAFCAGLLIHFGNVLAGYAQAVTHAIIARQVGRGFGGRDDVIGRKRVFGVRQLDVDDLGTGILQPGNALLPQRSISSGHAVHAVFARDSDLHALDGPPIAAS
jgi:hypothetical protein